MKEGLIASRYAKALYEFASDSKKEEEIYKGMKMLEKSFSLNKELNVVLRNPLLKKELKKQLIITAYGGEIDIVFERFIELILNNKREAYLQNIVLKYLDVYYEHKNLCIVKLTIAFPIDHESEKKLINSIKKLVLKDLIVEKEIDPEIIGGFILEIGDVRWDGSVATQLNKIHKKLTEVTFLNLN